VKHVNVVLASVRVKVPIVEKRGIFCFRTVSGSLCKYKTKEEALIEYEKHYGSEKEEKLEAKTSWSDGIQQTKAYKESPEKKSHRGGKSWNKD